MDKIWLASYPPYLPHEIEFGDDETLVGMIEAGFRKYPEAAASSQLTL